MKMKKLNLAVLLGIICANPAIAASYYNTSKQGFGSSGYAETNHTFNLPSGGKPDGAGYVKIELIGDFDRSNENARIYIDGDYIGRAYGGAARCQKSLTKKFPVSASQLAKWGADGKITVKVRNSRYVTGCTSSTRQHGVALKIDNLSSPKTLKDLSVSHSVPLT